MVPEGVVVGHKVSGPLVLANLRETDFRDDEWSCQTEHTQITKAGIIVVFSFITNPRELYLMGGYIRSCVFFFFLSFFLLSSHVLYFFPLNYDHDRWLPY